MPWLFGSNLRRLFLSMTSTEKAGESPVAVFEDKRPQSGLFEHLSVELAQGDHTIELANRSIRRCWLRD